MFNQTFNDYEIIITDNSENNDTKEMITKLNHPKIRYYKNKKNMGFTRNINKCVSYTKGKYVKYLMDDDLFAPTVLEEQIKILENSPEVGIVVCKSKEFLQNKTKNLFKNIKKTNKIKTINYINLNDFKNFSLCHDFAVFPTAVMTRKKCLSLVIRTAL